MPAVTRGAAAAPPGKTELPALWVANVPDYAVRVGYAADGARVAVGASSGDVRVFDAASGDVHWNAAVHPAGLLALAWCPRHNVLATGGHDGKALLLDGTTGAVLHELPAAAAWVEHVAWSPDGTRLATAAGKSVRLWNIDGTPLLETREHSSTVTGLQWNQDGSRLATCCYGGVHLWPVAAGAPAQHLPWKGSLLALTWSPNDQVVACGSQDCSVHFWRLATGQDSEMSGYPFKPKALGWSADSTLLATAGDAVATVWDFRRKGPEGTRPIQLKGHQGMVTALTFAPQGTVLATGAQDMGVLLWNPRKASKPVAYAFLDDYVSDLAWSPDGTRLTGVDASGAVVTWNATPHR